MGKAKLVYLILLLGLILRLVTINQSLWLDEAIGALAVRDFSYGELITVFAKADNHTPLFYIDLKFWTSIFGFSELALRFSPIIYGIFTVYLTYKIAIALSKNKFVANASSLLLATSQIHIYYSQESRMYSMAAFLASLAVYSFVKVSRRSQNNNYWWYIYSFATTCLVFTDYVPVFLLPIFWIVGWKAKKRKDWWKKMVLSHIPMIVLGVLWLPTLSIQAEHGGWLLSKLPGWREVAGGATFKQAALVWMKFVFGRISLMNKLAYYSLVGLSSIPFIISLFKAYRTKKTGNKLLWLWLLLPLSLGFLVSFWFPAFIYFRFIYVLPAFYILTSIGVGSFKSMHVKWIIMVTILSFNMLSWFIYVTDKRQQREQWKQVVQSVEANATEDDVVLFSYPKPFSPYRWYTSRMIKAVGVTDSISASEAETILNTKRALENKKGVYYFEYLSELSDPNEYVVKAIEEQGFGMRKTYDFSGVGFVHYYLK